MSPSFLKIWQVSSFSRWDNPGALWSLLLVICVMITTSITTQVVEPPVLVCYQHGLWEWAFSRVEPQVLLVVLAMACWDPRYHSCYCIICDWNQFQKFKIDMKLVVEARAWNSWLTFWLSCTRSHERWDLTTLLDSSWSTQKRPKLVRFPSSRPTIQPYSSVIYKHHSNADIVCFRITLLEYQKQSVSQITHIRGIVRATYGHPIIKSYLLPMLHCSSDS